MSNPVIKVNNLSKRYFIGAIQERPDTLRDSLMGMLLSPFRRAKKLLQGQSTGASELDEEFWALQEVSFEVKPGEVLGIIGRNGAGKSTLLKILSRITEPTHGFVEIRGRVGSLLEVGTGFHPELTGRENIYLNSAILGMKRREVDGKLKEILDFSEIGKFVDTPVKHYSSGMYVRLAFAVAAHLEPDIMIIDEVLAVGDAVFQRKCLGKMSEVSKEGRTVIFVSHNMGAIENLCTSALMLEEGKVTACGDVKATLRKYLNNSSRNFSDPSRWRRTGTGQARLLEAKLCDVRGNSRDVFCMGETVACEFTVEFFESFKAIDLALQVKKEDTGISVFHLIHQDSGMRLEDVRPGKRSFRVEIPDCLLYPTSYLVWIYVGTREVTLDYVENICSFSMVQSNIAMRTSAFSPKLGMVHAPSIWKEL